MPEYEANPTTSNLVFITTIGFDKVLWMARATQEAKNWLRFWF